MKELAAFIDHTALKPEVTCGQIDRLCDEAKEHGFYSVCVNGGYVGRCAQRLKGTAVKVCAVVGFPLGAMHPDMKRREAEQCLVDGASELDMVINIGALKSGDDALLARDIRGVVEAAKRHDPPALVKVIIETTLLTDDEKKLACRIAEECGADFVKTSTGFSGGGATVEDVRLMREAVGEKVKVKASGGIRDAETARAMVAAGASRLGTSSSVKIVSGERGTAGY